MKHHLTRGIATSCALVWPVLALAGQREDKYAFLAAGGAGGILIGLGLYTLSMILSAAYIRSRRHIIGLFVLYTLVFIYLEGWSFRLLILSLGFLQTPTAAPGTLVLTMPVKLTLAVVAVGAIMVFQVALRMWQKRHGQ
ncbi:hypothetical protein [Hymenobacter tenuis]